MFWLGFLTLGSRILKAGWGDDHYLVIVTNIITNIITGRFLIAFPLEVALKSRGAVPGSNCLKVLFVGPRPYGTILASNMV